MDITDKFRKLGLNRESIDFCWNLAKGDEIEFEKLATRRLFGEPEEYILGETLFRNISFKVDPRVYVPNHLTSHLVDVALPEIKRHHRVLDVGAGCGALGIAMAIERPNIFVYLSDISPYALEVARENVLHQDVANIDGIFESRHVDSVPIVPDIVVACLPWGTPDMVLGNIPLEELAHMPPHSLFNKNGPAASYLELVHSIQNRGWSTIAVIESGYLKEEELKEILPMNVGVEYIQFPENYSVTRLNIGPFW